MLVKLEAEYDKYKFSDIALIGNRGQKFVTNVEWLKQPPTSFRENPNLLHIMSDNPLALEGTTSNIGVLAKYLNALHAANNYLFKQQQMKENDEPSHTKEGLFKGKKKSVVLDQEWWFRIRKNRFKLLKIKFFSCIL